MVSLFIAWLTQLGIPIDVEANASQHSGGRMVKETNLMGKRQRYAELV
jgi:hypothetical protein